MVVTYWGKLTVKQWVLINLCLSIIELCSHQPYQGGKEEKFSVWFERLALYAHFEARIELDGHQLFLCFDPCLSSLPRQGHVMIDRTTLLPSATLMQCALDALPTACHFPHGWSSAYLERYSSCSYLVNIALS